MVVEKGSISKAAIALNMTQPPLSIAIRKFEDDLGLKLFERKGKRLHLTDAGKLMYERGNELVISSEKIIKEVKEKANKRAGMITVGCSTIANLTIIPEVVERMNRKNIGNTIKVLEGNTAFILDQLGLHKMDIGFVRNIFDKENYYTTALLSEPIYVALPPSHSLLGRKYVMIEDLADENFLMPHTSLGSGISDFVLENCQAAGFNPNIIYWGTETLPMLHMVNRGIGIAFVPALFTKVEGFTFPPLVKLRNPIIHAKLNLVTLKNSIHSSATESFLQIAKEVINEVSIELSITD